MCWWNFIVVFINVTQFSLIIDCTNCKKENCAKDRVTLLCNCAGKRAHLTRHLLGIAVVNRACKEHIFSQMHTNGLSALHTRVYTRVCTRVYARHSCIWDDARSLRRRQRPATTKLCSQVIGKGSDNDRDQFVFRVKHLRDTTLLQLW